jgi:hypothetical protein
VRLVQEPRHHAGWSPLPRVQRQGDSRPQGLKAAQGQWEFCCEAVAFAQLRHAIFSTPKKRDQVCFSWPLFPAARPCSCCVLWTEGRSSEGD